MSTTEADKLRAAKAWAICAECDGRGQFETGQMENTPYGWAYQTVDCAACEGQGAVASDANLDEILEAEWPQGRSVGAAAEATVARLGALDMHPLLMGMLNALLADAGRASTDRSIILRDFQDASPEACKHSRAESFERTNNPSWRHPREMPAIELAEEAGR